jgi:hypothetical protein
MSGTDSAGAADNYGGGDYDYTGYGGYGDPTFVNLYETSGHVMDLGEDRKHKNEQDMYAYIKYANRVLLGYENDKYFVKAKPHNEEMYAIDTKCAYLRELSISPEFTNHENYESELQRLKEHIEQLKTRRQWLYEAEHSITVEKIESANLVSLYIKRLYGYCNSEDEEYRSDYDPRKDPYLAKKLATANAYARDLGAIKVKEAHFQKLQEHIDTLIKDYGIRDVRDVVDRMMNPYTWTYNTSK